MTAPRSSRRFDPSALAVPLVVLLSAELWAVVYVAVTRVQLWSRLAVLALVVWVTLWLLASIDARRHR